MNDFRLIADEIADDVATGRLRLGDRLMPQRTFAYERGIAPSTAGRVYAELVHRGIVTGEVGRGTYVCAPSSQQKPALAEPASAAIDMETNYPILPDQHRLLSSALSVLASRADALDAAMNAPFVQGTASARTAVAQLLTAPDWHPTASSILFAGNGRQALAAAFSALVPVGGRIGFEALTYPVAGAIAGKLGFVAVALAMDGDGVRPDAVEKAHRDAPLHALYLQPTVQNPLGTTISSERRAQIAKLLQRLQGPVAIEDRVYAFLDDTAPPPLAAYAPDHVIVVDSLSKRVSPGLTLGFLAAPEHLVSKITKALITGAWTAQGFALDIGVRWIADGTVAELEAAKRTDARARQSISSAALAGLNTRQNPASYHVLLDLAATWRADAFVRAAELQGIAISPASAFAVSRGHAPNAVRLALAAPKIEELTSALYALANLARSEPEAAVNQCD